MSRTSCRQIQQVAEEYWDITIKTVLDGFKWLFRLLRTYFTKQPSTIFRNWTFSIFARATGTTDWICYILCMCLFAASAILRHSFVVHCVLSFSHSLHYSKVVQWIDFLRSDGLDKWVQCCYTTHRNQVWLDGKHSTETNRCRCTGHFLHLGFF